VSDLPPPPPAPRRARASQGRRRHRRRRDLVLVAVLVLVVLAGVLATRLVLRQHRTRGLACAPVDAGFLPALHLPTSAHADYAKVRTFRRAQGGASESVYLVAASVGGRTGVWAVDHDPGTPAGSHDVVIIAAAASTDARSISPKAGEHMVAGTYQPGVPASEVQHASEDGENVDAVEGCL
jgi:hypothetical protein